MASIITNYTPDDYSEVWALHCRTIAENDGFVKNRSFHSDLQEISSTYEAFFILRDLGQIIGMVGLKRIDDKTLEVKRLQVVSDKQGNGYGRLLMNKVLDYARANHVSRLCLNVSEPQMTARKLYLSLGFEITHSQHRVLGPDNEKFTSTYMQIVL